jgi:hypothetical protein
LRVNATVGGVVVAEPIPVCGRPSVLDLCGRRLLACPMSDRPDAELASDAMKMAAVRGGANCDRWRDLPYRPRIYLHCK